MGKIAKKPIADPTCFDFIEIHEGIQLSGGDDETITFEREYDNTPAVFVTPDSENTFSVDSKSTTEATITTAAGSDVNVDILVIGK